MTANIPVTAGRLGRRPAEQREKAAEQPPGPGARGDLYAVLCKQLSPCSSPPAETLPTS